MYRIRFDSCSLFLISSFDFGKNVNTLGFEHNSSAHGDDRKIHIFVLGKRPKQCLHDTAATAIYYITFTASKKKLRFSLHSSGSNSFWFFHVNTVKIYQFKSKDYELKTYSLCLGNISKEFTADNMEKLN